ncbi:Protein-associating with the carboxyl-terminal domain of ezrin [Dissophora globulifera]|nr:Protein-associating with the carboxyl-terminal domain of ezrin [Dissophora globulifera]
MALLGIFSKAKKCKTDSSTPTPISASAPTDATRSAAPLNITHAHGPKFMTPDEAREMLTKPSTIGTQPLQTTPIYTLRDAFYGKRPVSTFTYDPSQFVLDNKHEYLPKAIKKLKTIRHPSVLRFIDCKTGSAGVHLITEQVIPLTVEYLEEITEDEILVGLYDIMVALHFLHSQCHVSHNNVQLGSIFVSNGRWVLGGMEFTGTAAESMESGLTSLLSEELVPPEYQGKPAKMTSRDMDLPYATDVWQYGKLLETLIQDGLLHLKPGTLPLDRILDIDPRKRPPGDIILEYDLFTRNNAVSVVRYCRLKGLDKAQNAKWSGSILPKLQLLPQSIMERIVLPQVLTQEFFAADGFDELYRTLFTPQPPRPLISEEVYRSQVIPFMIKLWTYRQADIRMTVLRLFEVYLKAVVLGEGGSEVLGQIILPEILVGLQDADPKVYLASLCGLAIAIPYALLVTTLLDADATKQKFSVKSLYEQTLIPQIMAFWITDDSTQEANMQLVEVVMGMWCSIYTLGLHTHPAVKDMSATLTLTLVSVLKLSPISERVELISNSFTKHCTNGLFCISGLLKFLPQFLLDDDLQVREAAAKAISIVAHQTTTLVSGPETAADQQDQLQTDADANGASPGLAATTPSAPSPSPTPSAHVSRIRQYCEKQQSLLPSRRPIFSRFTLTGERSASSNSLKSFNGVDHVKRGSSNTDLLSSRRSSIVSQDSFLISEQSSLKTPSLMTPSLTRAGSFSIDSSSRDTLGSTVDAHTIRDDSDKPLRQHVDSHEDVTSAQTVQDPDEYYEDAMTEETRDDEIELMKALEAAKAEMRMRQLPLEHPPSSTLAATMRSVDINRNDVQSSAAFGWDDSGGDEADNWDTDDLATLTTPSEQSPSVTLEPTMEDEATRLRREQEKAEKQEQLRLKRDQKHQEMLAKREARRQQLAEKQVQKKGSTNVLESSTAKGTISAITPAPSSTAAVLPTSKPVSNRGRIQVTEVPSEDKDDWDVDENIDMAALETQAGIVEDELFKDLEVTYKAPAYVGGGGPPGLSTSTTSISSSTSSSITLSNSVANIPTAKTTQSPVTMTAATTLTTHTPKATFAAKPLASAGSSPALTPKRVASPLLRTASNGSLNSGFSNGVAGQAKPFVPISPKAAAITISTPPTTTSNAVPSLALQVDEAALEEDGWGDDWD